MDNCAIAFAPGRQHSDFGQPVDSPADGLAGKADIGCQRRDAHGAVFKPPDRGSPQDDGVYHGAAQFPFHLEDAGHAAKEVAAFVIGVIEIGYGVALIVAIKSQAIMAEQNVAGL